MMKKTMTISFAAAAAVIAIAPVASADSSAPAYVCVDTDLSHYVNNYGVCEGSPGSWVSVRIGATCVNTYADDFRC